MRLVMVVAVGLLLSSSAALAQSVSHDYDKRFDFATLKTYTWVPGTNLGDPINHKRIVDAIDAQLALKGLTRVEPDANPDALVAYHATFDQNIQVTGFSTGWGPYRFGPDRMGSATVEKIMIGTLVVDIVDAKSKTIVWRGMATKEIDVKASPEKREKNINRAVAKLFKSFPPKK